MHAVADKAERPAKACIKPRSLPSSRTGIASEGLPVSAASFHSSERDGLIGLLPSRTRGRLWLLSPGGQDKRHGQSQEPCTQGIHRP